MKTVFNLAAINNNEPATACCIEISEAQVAIIHYLTNPLIIAHLQIYSFEPNTDEEQKIADLKALLGKENVLNNTALAISIFINSKEFSFVPAEFYKSDQVAQLLNFIYGVDDQMANFSDFISSNQMYLNYRFPKKLATFIKESFPLAILQHSSGKQLEQPNSSDAFLSVMVGYTYTKVFVYNQNNFLLHRYINFNAAEDMSYELLNICAQFNIKVNEVKVALSGFIEANSNLYKELHKYFLNLNFDEAPAKLVFDVVLQDHPEHLFYPLFQLLPYENN